MNELVNEGKFRTDFFYRVSSQVLEMPSLRQRLDESPEELELMVGLLLERILGVGGDGVIDQVMDIIQRDVPGHYSWPGNVRELEQVIRRALLARKIEKQDLIKKSSGQSLQRFEEGLTARALMTRYCNQLFKRHGTYEAVARASGLDRRTVKKYVEAET